MNKRSHSGMLFKFVADGSDDTKLNAEQLKIKATFYNNVAIALTVTCIAVPFLVVSGNDMKVIHDCVQAVFYNAIPGSGIEDIAYSVIAVLGVVLCSWIARRARKEAIRLLGAIDTNIAITDTKTASN